MSRTLSKVVFAGVMAATFSGCAQTGLTKATRTDAVLPMDPAPSSGSNTLTDAERAAGWKLLFVGSSLNEWRVELIDAVALRAAANCAHEFARADFDHLNFSSRPPLPKRASRCRKVFRASRARTT